MNRQLSWSGQTGGGHLTEFAWDDVAARLNGVRDSPGTVTLETFEPHQHLQLRADGGLYLLMLGRDTEDDWEVLTLHDTTRAAGNAVLLGDRWDNRILTADIEAARVAFREFFDLGKISSIRLE